MAQIELPKRFKSRFKSQLRLAFARHCSFHWCFDTVYFTDRKGIRPVNKPYTSSAQRFFFAKTYGDWPNRVISNKNPVIVVVIAVATAKSEADKIDDSISDRKLKVIVVLRAIWWCMAAVCSLANSKGYIWDLLPPPRSLCFRHC